MAAGERRAVWFNIDTERDLYEEARSMQFSTEVKKWLKQRIAIRAKGAMTSNGDAIPIREIPTRPDRR